MAHTEVFTSSGEGLTRWLELARNRSEQLQEGKSLDNVRVIFSEEELEEEEASLFLAAKSGS